MSVVQQGLVEYTLGGGRRVLSAGEGILINVNVPHAYVPLSEGNVELLTVIVHPAFLSGCRQRRGMRAAPLLPRAGFGRGARC